MREQSAALDELGARVFAVTFESRQRVEDFLDAEPLPYPVLRDPQRRAYAMFGLERRPATTIWGPSTLLYYGRSLLKGRLPVSSRDSDQYQLGGDVIVRADGRAGWIYQSSNPADRPTISSLLQILRFAVESQQRH